MLDGWLSSSESITAGINAEMKVKRWQLTIRWCLKV